MMHEVISFRQQIAVQYNCNVTAFIGALCLFVVKLFSKSLRVEAAEGFFFYHSGAYT
jgi:hypothetical protein